MTNTVLLAVGYTRVSIGEQVKGHSLDAQATHIRNYAASQGWHLVKVYTDAGISAKQGSKRPSLEELLSDACAGQFDIVIVDKIDRFSRHLGSLLTILDQLNNASVAFVSVQERLDLTTPWGKLMLTVLGMLAEIYIDNLRQETRKGKVQRARKGLWNGNIPLGYCKGLCSKCTDLNGAGYCPNFGQPDLSDGKRLVAHPIESVAVKLAFEWYTNGQPSDGKVADMLNAYPYVLPDNTVVHFRTKGIPGYYLPRPFAKDSVRDLLQRPLYVGKLVYRGSDDHGGRRRRRAVAEIFESSHPILIDQATFDKAQEIRKTLFRVPRVKHGHPSEIYPLAGILRCADCGLAMRAASTRGRRYYRDATRIEHKGPCEQPTILANDIEAQVADLICRVQLPDDWPDSAAEWLGLQGRAESQQAQERWERAKEMYLKGEIKREDFDAERQRYELYNESLTKLEAGAIIELGHVMRLFVPTWAEALPIEKKKLLRLTVAAVFVRGNSLVALQATPAFLPLVLRAFSQEGESCNCGDDGIRTRGLCLDRAAC